MTKIKIPSRNGLKNQIENPTLVKIAMAVNQADIEFESTKILGSSVDWVQNHFLPYLEDQGLTIKAL
jgi:hypothetical protein